MRRLLTLTGAAVLVVAGVTVAPAPPTSATASDLVVFVSPAGDDTSNGLSEYTPVRTLTRAEQVVAGERVGRPALVCMAPGTYPTSGVHWTHVLPGVQTKIAGRCWGGAGDTVLHGGGTQLVLRFLGPGETARVDSATILQDVTITGAANGLGVNDGFDNLTVRRVAFLELGDRYAPDGTGYFAFQPMRSTGWRVEDSTFTRIENAADGLIHAVYAAHRAQGGQVIRTRFHTTSGDPIRVRNDSSGNTFTDLVFIDAGNRAPLSDWYNPAAGETRSTGNTIWDSAWGHGYTGQPLVVWYCYDRPGGACESGRFHRSRSDFSWCAVAPHRCGWADLVPGEDV